MITFKLSHLALVVAVAGISGHSTTVVSANSSTTQAQAKAEHRNGASHRHCHRRLRDGRFVTICHNHRHWIFHHSGKKG